MSKEIKTAISIGRNSLDEVHIRVECRASNSEFVDVVLSYEEFAKALTGLSMVDCHATVRNLGNVGKKKVIEGRKVECPLDTYSRDVLSKWLTDNCQEEGWTLSAYLGSQTSVSRVDGKTILNYSVFKYIESDDTPDI